MKMTRRWRTAAAVPAVVLAGQVLTPAALATGNAGGHQGTTGVISTGVISTLAGGVGGPAKATRVGVFVPCGVSYGNNHLYVANAGSVRSVNARTDWLTTPAGTGSPGPLGDAGPATAASVGIPPILGNCGITLDHAGNLVITDPGNERIRIVAHRTGTFYGQPMTAGHMYIAAGNGKHGFSGDGGPAASAELNFPYGVAADATGNLVIADSSNNRVRVVARSTGTFYGQPMTAGDIYTVAGDGAAGFSGDGGPATSASLNFPRGVAADGSGNLVIADGASNRIRVVAGKAGTFYGRTMTAGDIYTVAGDGTAGFSGDGGPATSAAFSSPEGVAVDGLGNLVIADTNNNRVRVVAATTGTFYGQPMTAGDVYTVAGDGTAGFSGDNGPAVSAEIHGAPGIAVDGSGNVLITDTGSNRVRLVATRTGTFYGQSLTAGDIYTLAGNGTAGFSGNGGPAVGAELSGPTGITVDGAGNVLFADMTNTQIREISG